jgi:hypothetical protein
MLHTSGIEADRHGECAFGVLARTQMHHCVSIGGHGDFVGIWRIDPQTANALVRAVMRHRDPEFESMMARRQIVDGYLVFQMELPRVWLCRNSGHLKKTAEERPRRFA